MHACLSIFVKKRVKIKEREMYIERGTREIVCICVCLREKEREFLIV